MTLMDYPLFHGLVVLYSTCFELQGAHHQGVHFFYTVQAVSGILYNLLLYSTRSPTCSVPDSEHVGERVEYSKRLYSMPGTACTV